MNQAHLHLALSHFPVIASVIGFLILSYGIIVKRSEFQKAALFILILAALIAVPVFLTGEGAEEMVENIKAIEHDNIEEHEELGKVTFWVIVANGILSILQLINLGRGRPARFLVLFILLISLGCSALGLYTANLGGKIRHPEILQKQQ
jgi:uncharacterized membrane protein